MSEKDIALMAHLMRRAGFGATREEIEARVAKGYEQTVEELLDPDNNGVPEMDTDIFFRYYPSLEAPQAPPNGRSNMIYYMINTPRPLEEKMTLFWHHLFATGNSKVDNPTELDRQIRMFRANSLGNYRELLVELSRDPAMIFWLDNNENHKDMPNENWGRELLELFSMGQGNYTEQDVFECSRAFTGWTIGPKIPRLPLGRFLWSYRYDPDDHDDGEKLFLGQKGNFNGEDIIDIVVQQPATSRFIARHLYNFFVADEVQVPAWQDVAPRDPVAINQIGAAFTNSGYDIRATLRTLFNSEFFKDEAVRWAKVKSPAEVVAGTMRLVKDFQFPRPGLQPIGEEPGYMGQELANPPSVEGWHTGAEWIDSGSLVRRINFVADRVGNLNMPGVRDIVSRVRAQGTISPDQLVQSCLDMLGSIEIGAGTQEQLKTHARLGGEVQWGTEQESDTSTRRVAEMLQLIGATREYQFC